MTCGHVCLATINLQLPEIGFTFSVVTACLLIFPSLAILNYLLFFKASSSFLCLCAFIQAVIMASNVPSLASH